MKSDQSVAVWAFILVIVIAINQINSVDSNCNLCYYSTTRPHPPPPPPDTRKMGELLAFCITSLFEELNLFFQNGW